MELFFPVRPDLTGFLGSPEPAPGARVVFSEQSWLAARRRAGHPEPAPDVHWRAGFHVYRHARDVLTWPCRLWRVRDVADLRGQEDERWFSTCRELTVVDEVPSWWVLGPHGEHVAEFIEEVRALTPRQVALIAAVDVTAEREVVRRGAPADLGNCASHVNVAFHEAADRVGDHLRTWDADLGSLTLSDPAWLRAGQAVHAALRAIAAPEAYSAAEREVLARRWDARGAAHT